MAVLKEKRTKNGWLVRLIEMGGKVGYVVTSSHDKKRGYSTRYSGKNKTLALKHYNR